MQTLRLTVLALVLLALAPLTASAQAPITPGQSLFFDHSGVNVDTWDYRIDTSTWVGVTPTKGAATEGGAFAWSFPFPAVTPGVTHTIQVRACNTAGCGESDPFAFRLIAVPAKPVNLRIGTAPQP